MDSEEQEWIEAPDGWGMTKEDHEENENGDSAVLDLFGNNDPKQSFAYRIDNTKTIHLHGYKLDSDQVDHSTGVTLWQAAPRLADYIQKHNEICKGKSVHELGAGLGLCGIIAHYVGAARVVMSDGDTKTLKGMRENVQQNCDAGANIACKQLLWGSPYMEKFVEENETYDTILGADIIYTKESIQPLFDTVACLLKKPHGKFVLIRYNKWNNVDDEVVIEAAKIRNLDCTRSSEGIFVFHWKEKRG